MTLFREIQEDIRPGVEVSLGGAFGMLSSVGGRQAWVDHVHSVVWQSTGDP